jgi:hypothetical protein
MSVSETPADRPPVAVEGVRWVLLLGVVAVLAALAALVFVGLVAAGQSITWPNTVSPDPFSESWRPVFLLTAAVVAMLLGQLIERALKARMAARSQPTPPPD